MQEITEFNLERATAKILMLKEQTSQNIIVIGKTLIEVKENIGHGNFGSYLEKQVEFSHYTANRFMKIASEFSNSTAMCNLNSTKLFLLAGLDEEDRQEVIQENNLEDMTTRQLEQVVKEKKEIKKQLEEEQEYSQELQEAIREKDREIQALKKAQPKTEIIEKEVIKEVIPDEVKDQIDKLEKEKEQLQNDYEKAKSTIITMNNMKNAEIGKKYYDYDFDGLSAEVVDFIRKASKFTYMEQEYLELPNNKKSLVKSSVKKIEDWLLDMKKAMNETLMIENNIYIEGENENE